MDCKVGHGMGNEMFIMAPSIIAFSNDTCRENRLYLMLGFPTRSDTNQPAQLQKLVHPADVTRILPKPGTVIS